MANPNNVYRNASRRLVMVIEEVIGDRKEAEKRRDALKTTGSFHMVKLTSFRTGPRTTRVYSYCVRAYNKPK